MKAFRCRICEEPYLGSERPTHCPFCGAHQKYLLPAGDYQPLPVGELGQKSRDNLQRVLELEIGNCAFFRGASKVADDEEGKALFLGLTRIAAAHAALVCRLLAIPIPEELDETGDSSPAHKENLAETRRRKERAVLLFGRFGEEAEEERVAEVLGTFVEVASDHLALAQ